MRRSHARRHYSGHRARHRHHDARRGRHIARADARRIGQFRNSDAALMPQDGVSSQGAPATGFASSVSAGVSNVVAEARRFIGGNPTGRRSLWCARFMNMVLQRSGHKTTGSDMARSFASYGRRVSGPQVGAIAVMSRGRGGGHVGVVSGIDGKGNPIVVSGNHGRRVAESVYSRSRIYAYVMPN